VKMSLLKEWVNQKTGQRVSLLWTETEGDRNDILRFVIEERNGAKVSFTPTYNQITSLLQGLEFEEKTSLEAYSNDCHVCIS